MKKILLFTVVLAMMLASLPIQNALAATEYKLTVVNYTNDTIFVTLVEVLDEDDDDDPKEYELRVDRFDDNSKNIPKGEYAYSYNYCRTTISGTVKMNKERQWNLLPCGVEHTKMRFNSHFAQTITVNMYGPLEMPEPEDEEYTVELGGNRIPDILSGTYIMSYEAACGPTDPGTVTFSEEIEVTKNGKTQITLHGCEWYDHPARIYDKPVPVKFKIINHASFSIVLQLVGPQGELLDIHPGTNLVTLIYGTYKYGYFLDGNYYTGYMMVTKNGLGSLVLRPSHIHELPTTGTETDSGE
jgi:hypothetical protein